MSSFTLFSDGNDTIFPINGETGLKFFSSIIAHNFFYRLILLKLWQIIYIKFLILHFLSNQQEAVLWEGFLGTGCLQGLCYRFILLPTRIQTMLRLNRK